MRISDWSSDVCSSDLLPYGRKRALEIATTLALEPELLLLDEPTAGMAQEDVERITALIGRIRQDRTILMVEHNLSVVASLANPITVHRSEERRGGKEWVSNCKYRLSPNH